jgi:hypothetical protein
MKAAGHFVAFAAVLQSLLLLILLVNVKHNVASIAPDKHHGPYASLPLLQTGILPACFSE